MSQEFRKRMTKFLDEYYAKDKNAKRNEFGFSEITIKSGIAGLLEKNIFTAKTLSKKLLEYDIVLPEYRINKYIKDFEDYLKTIG